MNGTPGTDAGPQGSPPWRRIHVVINPASGQPEPILLHVHDALCDTGIDWQVSVTHTLGDGERLARAAIDKGAELVVACGGDGTVMDVASALVERDVPLAILPAGTSNSLAEDLGLPPDLRAAAGLLAGGCTTRPIDVGTVADRPFLLRVAIGIDEAASAEVDREQKARLGILSYFLSAARAVGASEPTHFSITLDDGEPHQESALACIVANGGAVGALGLRWAEGIDPSDGVLDVLLARERIGALVELALHNAPVPWPVDLRGVPRSREDAQGGESSGGPGDPGQPDEDDLAQALSHEAARSVRIETDPVRGVYADGERVTETPVEITLKPAALNVVVPTSRSGA